jgi:DNA-binding Xre family transcriptional regulator
MSKKSLSTYDEFIQDPEEKKLLENDYRELVLSELFLALMDEDQISVRRLAKAAGISPTIIQELRTGKKDNLTLKTFLLLIESLGYSLILEKTPQVKSSSKKSIQKRRRIHFSLKRKSSHLPKIRKGIKIRRKGKNLEFVDRKFL